MIGVVEDKENIEIFPTTNAADENLKLELKLHIVAKIMNLLYQEVVYFQKLHLYWLENVMNIMVQVRKILCPEFLCFNQRHFISINLS